MLVSFLFPTTRTANDCPTRSLAVRMPGNDKLIPVLRGRRDLHEAGLLSDGVGLVFPSRRGKALSDMTLSKLVKEQGIAAMPHGFRSSFWD